MEENQANLRDNGGPAFPQDEWSIDSSEYLSRGGMSLRDYFAAQAMQRAMPGDWYFNGGPVNAALVAEVALMSYQFADAMLKARGA